MLVVALALVLAQQEAATPPAGAAPPATVAPGPGEDFDLLPQEPIPDAAAVARGKELERKLELRRKVLRLHQLGGVLMLANLGTTVVLGELDYIDKYGGGGDTGQWHLWHRWTAISAATLFAGTAALAVFAPVPVEKPVRLDTATLHKVFMSIASAGMVTQIVLGIVTANKEGAVAQRDYALAHQIVGFGTFAAAAAGFGVWIF
jgi:hypothetical protein